MKKITIIMLLQILSGYIFSQSINLELENNYINMGESTTFKIIATGDIKSLKKTDSNDINLTQIGNNTSFSNINGKTTRSYILEYRVKPLKTGEVKLPIFYLITNSGEQLATEEKTLYVSELEDSKDIEHDMEAYFETKYAKLFLNIPEKNLYVGEAIPVKVIAYFLTNPQPGIIRVPYIKNGSFILDLGNGKSNSKQEVIIKGEKWLPVEWNCILTPLKSGELEIQLIMDSYINIQKGNNGFFSNFEKEEITTTTELRTINILQLPVENRPESFTGAIGDFNMNSSINLNELNVGDPLTLTIDIYGTGNFQRLNIPSSNLQKELWKVYPESSTFNGTNQSNYIGVKSFQQILAPLKENITELPIFEFSFFNPNTELFTTLKTDEFKLDIKPNDNSEEYFDSYNKSEFEENKEIMRHKKHGNNTNIGDIKIDIISKILLVLIFLLLISNTVIFIINRVVVKNKYNNKISKTNLNEIKSLESSEKYLEALLLYKKLIIKKVLPDIKCKEESITSSDLDNNTYKKFFMNLEDIIYSKKVITKSEYDNLISSLEQELFI